MYPLMMQFETYSGFHAVIFVYKNAFSEMQT